MHKVAFTTKYIHSYLVKYLIKNDFNVTPQCYISLGPKMEEKNVPAQRRANGKYASQRLESKLALVHSDCC